MLRTPDNTREVVSKDMIFFEMGPTGAHQPTKVAQSIVALGYFINLI